MEQQIEKTKSLPRTGSRLRSNRESYLTAKIEIIKFGNVDVITTSITEKDVTVDDKDDWNLGNW